MFPGAQDRRPLEQIVSRPEDLPDVCQFVASHTRFGLDTEFVGEDSYHPHLCLVQVATPDRLFLIDPLTVGPLEAFWNLVTDAEHQVVVHAGREEVRLCRLWAGQPPGNLFDLQIAAGLVRPTYPLSHGNLVHQLLGVQLDKGETLTEWRDRPLTRAQIRYAFDDVRFLLPLCEKLTDRLETLGRSRWAAEEFARLAANGGPDDVPVERWRKIKGLGSLDRRRLAFARALYEWREQTAARTNRPARAICRDDLIVEIARKNPHRERDLQVIRGLPRRDLGAILHVLEQARALPANECPAPIERDQDPPQVGMVANVLGAILADWCARHSLASSLVTNSGEIKALVRARLQHTELPAGMVLNQGWRARHVLPELLAFVEGRASLRIGQLSASSPFAIGTSEPA